MNNYWPEIHRITNRAFLFTHFIGAYFIFGVHVVTLTSGFVRTTVFIGDTHLPVHHALHTDVTYFVAR